MNFFKLLVDIYLKKLFNRKQTDLLPTTVKKNKNKDHFSESLNMPQPSNGKCIKY